jgi:hypothetical protein
LYATGQSHRSKPFLYITPTAGSPTALRGLEDWIIRINVRINVSLSLRVCYAMYGIYIGRWHENTIIHDTIGECGVSYIGSDSASTSLQLKTITLSVLCTVNHHVHT